MTHTNLYIIHRIYTISKEARLNLPENSLLFALTWSRKNSMPCECKRYLNSDFCQIVGTDCLYAFHLAKLCAIPLKPGHTILNSFEWKIDFRSLNRWWNRFYPPYWDIVRRRQGYLDVNDNNMTSSTILSWEGYAHAFPRTCTEWFLVVAVQCMV